MKETNTAQMQRKFLDEYSNTLDIRASALAARYGKRTGVAVARNMLKTEKIQKELNALCERKTEHLEVCLGYIIGGYLKVLKWALSLRALDGITKQLGSETASKKGVTGNTEAQIPIITEIKGLDTEKI